MRNQIIKNAPKLPNECKWHLKSVGTSTSILTKNLPPISDFDEVIFKQKKGVNWLVELHRDEVISFGYVVLEMK